MAEEQAQPEPQADAYAAAQDSGVQGLPAFDVVQAAATGQVHAGESATNSIDAAPVEQFYETKLFRVLVSRKALVNGHVVIEPKAGHAHLYSFDLDEMEEFGYLIKKVSFWAMRLVGAQGFSVMIHDGTPEVDLMHPLRIHILPRIPGDEHFSPVSATMSEVQQELEEGTVVQMVNELKDLMQLPQQ